MAPQKEPVHSTVSWLYGWRGEENVKLPRTPTMLYGCCKAWETWKMENSFLAFFWLWLSYQSFTPVVLHCGFSVTWLCSVVLVWVSSQSTQSGLFWIEMEVRCQYFAALVLVLEFIRYFLALLMWPGRQYGAAARGEKSWMQMCCQC